MPSGSHGGSPGSHGGGGFHSSSSGGGNGPGRVPRPMFFVHRGYYIPATPAEKIRSIVALLCVMFVSLLAFIAIFAGANSDIKRIENDRNRYLRMIENAEAHPEYSKEGVVVGNYYNEDAGKWYFTYAIEQDDGGTLEGYSYSLYTASEIQTYAPVGKTLTFATDHIFITSRTDSIDMGYKDLPISADGEYVGAKRNKKAGMIGLPVLSTIIVGLGVYIVLKIRKSKQTIEPGTNIDELRAKLTEMDAFIASKTKSSTENEDDIFGVHK